MKIVGGFFEKDVTMELLHLIDDKLTMPYEVIVCGTTALHVQGYDYRRTTDVDFAKPLSSMLWAVIDRVLKENPNLNSRVYDDQAAGVLCFLEDFEDRLVEIEDNFKQLKVYAMSVEDWIVTQLEAKKFDSVLKYPQQLTRERLQFIEDNMHLYCGLKEDYARQSLKILWEKLDEVESAGTK